MPGVPESRPSARALIGGLLPKLQAPLADSFIDDVDTTFEQESLPVAVAQGGAVVEADAVANTLAGAAVIFVALGLSGRGMSGGRLWCSVGF